MRRRDLIRGLLGAATVPLLGDRLLPPLECTAPFEMVPLTIKDIAAALADRFGVVTSATLTGLWVRPVVDSQAD